MIKLTKLTFELKDEAQQMIDDITAIYQEEVENADKMGNPPPMPPKPIKLKNHHYHVYESPYYVEPHLIEEIFHDPEETTIINVSGRDCSVKETVEEVYNLKQAYANSK